MTHMTVSILPVTDPGDLLILTNTFMDATKDTDSFHEMMVRYAPKGPYEAMMDALTKSLNDPNHYIFKAVIRENGNQVETIVGMAQWKIGYIEIEKLDPFAEKHKPAETVPAQTDAAVAPLVDGEIEKVEEIERKIDGFKEFRRTRTSIVNEYIKHIRGKRHVFLGRIAVHPDHQKQGIAGRLLEWGVDLADEQGIVAYLNARPVAKKLYEKAGWKAVATTHFVFDDLEVAPITSMLRLPVPERKREL